MSPPRPRFQFSPQRVSCRRNAWTAEDSTPGVTDRAHTNIADALSRSRGIVRVLAIRGGWEAPREKNREKKYTTAETAS